jgi:hypothetical protein
MGAIHGSLPLLLSSLAGVGKLSDASTPHRGIESRCKRQGQRLAAKALKGEPRGTTAIVCVTSLPRSEKNRSS